MAGVSVIFHQTSRRGPRAMGEGALIDYMIVGQEKLVGSVWRVDSKDVALPIQSTKASAQQPLWSFMCKASQGVAPLLFVLYPQS